MLSRLESERTGSATAVLRAQEAERARVARDLHDEVNQALAAVSLRLAATAEHAPPEFAEELAETQRLAGQAMQELLGLARELRPSALDDHGLLPALRTQVRLFGERWGIPAHFAADGTRPLLGEFEQLVVYRVVQEALSNIARHAQRQEGQGHGAGLQQRPGEGDDHRRRRRLSPRPPARRRAPGLAGMRERALLAGGRLELSTPGARRAARPSSSRVRARARDASSRWSAMRLLIADDHGIVRGGLRLLLDRQPDMEVVAEACDGVEAVQMALRERPDICVLDVSMPRMTGLQATVEIKTHAPDIAVLVLSMYDDERYLFEALQAGAVGLHPQAGGRHRARRRRPRGRARRAVHDERRRAVAAARVDGRRQSSGPVEPLTLREREVLKLIAEAYTNKQIGETLHLSEKTVESHRANLMRKLEMRDRVELVRYAIRRGLIEA